MFALLLLPAAGESLAQTLPAPTTFEFSVSCNTPSPSCYVAEDDAGSPAAGVTTTITVTAAYPSGTSTPTTETVLTVTVTGGASNSEATVVVDFVAVPVFELTIEANERLVTGTFEFVTVADATSEGPERVTVTPTTTAAIITTTPAAVTFRITDNDSSPTVVISSLDTTSVTEDSSTTIISVTAAYPVGSRAVENRDADTMFTVSAGTATEDTSMAENDYEVSATTFTVTIARGDLEGTGSFVLTVNDDTVLETTPETIILTPTSTLFTPVPTTLTIEIVDDDTQADTITLSVDPASVTEDSGTPTITVTASLAENTATATDLAVTLTLVTGTGAGSATATDDFTVGTISVITITAGMLTGTGTFMLTVVDDALPEVAETLVFSATAITDYTFVNATLTIEDNDMQADTITLSLDPTSVGEGAVTPTTITVTASIPDGTATGVDLPVTVALVTTGDDAGSATLSLTATDDPGDGSVSTTSTLITITAGTLTGSGTFMLTVVDDVLPEGDETLVFSGTLDAAVTGFSDITNAALTIVDDEAPQADRITLSLDPTSVPEGTDTTTETPEDGVVTTITEITVTARIPDGTATGEDLPVTVTLVPGTGPGSATLSLTTGDDPGDGSVSTTSTLITILAGGERTATGTFMLTVIDDEDTEGNETLVFSGMLNTTGLVATFNPLIP